jgi:uncharacterized protein YdeI (YjbR/CyaY-like superfamily)
MEDGEVHFFATPGDWRRWLEENHATNRVLRVGFHKKGSGQPSITWPEAVDQALCFGWIDGVRRSIDDRDYEIRFTPRKAGSNWSAVNVKRVQELTEQGLMRPAGLKAFEARKPEKTGIYSFEQRQQAVLDPAHEAQFRANPQAWSYFESRPPSYRKAAIWWIVSAKQEATRLRRLQSLIDESERGRAVPPLTRPVAKTRQNEVAE